MTLLPGEPHSFPPHTKPSLTRIVCEWCPRVIVAMRHLSLGHRTVPSGVAHPHIQFRDFGPATTPPRVVHITLISRLHAPGLLSDGSNFTAGVKLVPSASSRERGRHPRRKRSQSACSMLSVTLYDNLSDRIIIGVTVCVNSWGLMLARCSQIHHSCVTQKCQESTSSKTASVAAVRKGNAV